MKRPTHHMPKKQYVVTLLLLTAIYLGNIMSTRSNVAHKPTDGIGSRDKTFAGSASCNTCHKAIYESHIKTAHYLDSRPAAKSFIKGSFEPGKNHFVYNRFMEVVLENHGERFFQTAYINGESMQSEPFDVVIGSGRKGQTFLYWEGKKLFQLPVSYYSPLDSWCNSPGYPTNYIRFNRPIPAQCIECHGTYAETTIDNQNATLFEKDKMIYGVDCERCHGPAAAHVDYQTKHPDEKNAQFIINAKKLSRQQRLDACALCHSGFRTEMKPAFSFVTGDKLDDYSSPAYAADTVSALDVHGNQYGLLTASKCFKADTRMDCSSCHNVHINEANSPKIFSQRCMNCHNETSHDTCTISPIKGLMLKNNCIDCHMPAMPSKKIFLQLSDPAKSTPDLVRTHRIGIYRQITKEYIDKMTQFH